MLSLIFEAFLQNQDLIPLCLLEGGQLDRAGVGQTDPVIELIKITAGRVNE